MAMAVPETPDLWLSQVGTRSSSLAPTRTPGSERRPGSGRPGRNNSLGATERRDFAAIFEECPELADVYAARCNDSGEAPHLEQAQRFRDVFLAQNPSSGRSGSGGDKTLRLCGLRLGATAVSSLALHLKDRREYVRLDLADNHLGDHAVLTVRSLVHALPRLRHLGLARNDIGPGGARELADELEGNDTLEILDLGAAEQTSRCAPRGVPQGRPNDFGTEGLQPLLAGLLRNPHRALTSLVLRNTALCPEAGRHLAAFLEQDRVLKHLDVSSNPLTSEGVHALLPKCMRLRWLSVANTGCRGELIHSQLNAMLQEAQELMHLSLSQNLLEARSLRRTARAVASCPALASLDLADSSLDAEGITILADALAEASVPTLTELDVSRNKLAQAPALEALARLAGSPVLQVLRLTGVAGLGDEGARELAGALDPMQSPEGSLERLELGSCQIGNIGAGHLLSSLAQNKSLLVLGLSNNYLDDGLDLSLLEKLTHLQEFQLNGSRLSRGARQRAAQVCARNRQRARDEVPSLLRNEMHSLLFQEQKLSWARKKVEEDENELKGRVEKSRENFSELQQLKNKEAQLTESLGSEIEQKEQDLEARREHLAATKRQLEETAAHFEAVQLKLRATLRQREQELVELQACSDELDKDFAYRATKHPIDVATVRGQIEAAEGEREHLRRAASEMRQQRKALQARSLLDLKP